MASRTNGTSASGWSEWSRRTSVADRMASTSWRARGALAVLVAGYGLIAMAASAPDSPLTPPLPPGVGVPSALARLARWLGLDRLGRFGLTVFVLCALAGLVVAFVLLVV